ncbi:hypothetical protein MAR_020944 [Mya arenaria]|uniref:Uncharacterized protein n=1 Tax=Mya arenaria TaxID=6604 RepID=A0ABY7E9B0_MYAAR|nr:hypothetical protein MAR_020944 [Mya arenaria]
MSVKLNASDRHVQQKLIDMSIEHNLTQVHTQPTREDNILDLVFTNNPSLTKSSISIPGISDHAMVVTDSDIKPFYNIEKPRKVYLYSKANWDNISLECSKLSDDLVYMSGPNVEMMWERLKTGIQSIMDTNIPSKMFRKRNTVPWFNRTLKKMMRRKGRLYNHAKKTKQWIEFKCYQKMCKKEFKKVEINYINKTIHEGLENNNSKPFWRYLKSKRQDNIGTAPLKQKGVLVNEGTGKAQILLEQFSSVFTRNTHRSLPVLEKQYKYNLPSLCITTPGVEKLLSKLNTSKAMGPDKISNVILKNCARQLAPAACYHATGRETSTLLRTTGLCPSCQFYVRHLNISSATSAEPFGKE